MSVAPADLRTNFPTDFPNTTTDPDPALQACIDNATLQVGDPWTDAGMADLGVLYLAAHLRVINKRGSFGAAGMVQSKRVGDVSVTYAVPAMLKDAGSLAMTPYGAEFLRMIYTLPGARAYVDQSDNQYSAGGFCVEE